MSTAYDDRRQLLRVRDLSLKFATLYMPPQRRQSNPTRFCIRRKEGSLCEWACIRPWDGTVEGPQGGATRH